MNKTLTGSALDILFMEARTHNSWTDQAIDDATLARIWEIARMGATSANCSPARIVFVRSPEAKDQLKSCLAEGNIEKTMAAPVTAIIGHDMAFYEKLPTLFPHTDAKSWFIGNQELIETTAFRNGTLQGAYLMLAARALGLDCGPMSGFDNAAVDAQFFAGTDVRSNFICNIGYGTADGLYPRAPRLPFEEACRIA